MKTFTIEAGLKFLRDAQPFIVISLEDNRVVVENTVNRAREVLSVNEMEIDFLNGDLLAVFENVDVEEASVSAVDMLNEKDRNEFNRKCAYVKKLIDLSAGMAIKKYIPKAISEVAAEIGDPKAPGESTVYRWFLRWSAGGENLSALIPKSNRRGPQSIHMRKDAQRIVQAVLEEKFLVREGPTLLAVMPDIEGAFKKHNEALGKHEQLPLPSLSSVYRFLKRMDAYEVMIRRKGKHAADQYFRAVGAGVVADAPLDQVQIDHTVLDIHVITPVRNIVARPTLTVALDVHSRIPIGIYVGFASPGYEAVMLCLRNAILPKGKLLEHFPQVEASWPCYGVPRTLVLDNGMEFHSEHLKDVCSMLGMNIVYHPVKAPHYKGAVERFFRTVNTGLLSMLPGKTFSNSREKGDYDSVAKAAIPFKVFEEALYKWIVDVYARRFHHGIEDIPVEVWEKGIKDHPADLPVSPQDLLVLLCEVKRPTLTSRGIQIDNVKYNSSELNSYFRRIGKATKVKVKVDPLDVGHVYVFEEMAQKFITVPALKAEFQGLSKWQHKIVRRLINIRRKEGKLKYDVSEALREIGNYIENTRHPSKKKSHKRIGRYSSYAAGFTHRGNKPSGQEVPPTEPLDFDFGAMDVTELLSAAEQAGWSNLNDEGSV